MGKLVIDYEWSFEDGLYSLKNEELCIHGFDHTPEGAISMFLNSLYAQWNDLVDCPIEDLYPGRTVETRKALMKKFKEYMDAKD